jgi:cyclopropane fatty-acyl-phospholipid synthase-like methyltransferase
MSKKYKLLKDLPDCKAGTILELSEDGESYDYKAQDGAECWYRRHYVESNSDWFQLVEEPKNEEQDSIAEIIEMWRNDYTMTSHRIATHIIDRLKHLNSIPQK